MKKKLFENVGGNQFKLVPEESQLDWNPVDNPEMDEPNPTPHNAEKKFTVNVGGKLYDYLATTIPDGTFHHVIEDQNGSLISLAPDADPKRLLTQDEVKAEIQKFLSLPPKTTAKLNAPPGYSNRGAGRFGGQ